MGLFIGLVAACGSGADNSAPAPQTSNAVVKIMPLGDSITQSSAGLNSYRYYLWHLLLDHGYHVDFVGTRHGVGGPPESTDFDMDHEGHPGWRADEILAQLQAWAAAASPDVVLLHIGTNDLSQGQSVDSTVDDISSIIDLLRMVNPRIRILLAQIIAKTGLSSIAVLNGRLSTLVADKQQAQSPLALVDQYSGFDPATMTYDGTHPNDVGNSQMAGRWFEKLAPMLDAFLRSTARDDGHPMR